MQKNKIGTSTSIEKITQTANDHYGEGEITFVGLKYQYKEGWIAKIKRENGPSITGHSLSSSGKALKRLHKRLNKIIDRYNMI